LAEAGSGGPGASGSQAGAPYAGRRVAVLGILAMLIVMPVTLPVTVLRELVQERFAVSELATSLFMSINMVGAVLSAPLAGALADRFGRRAGLVAAALVCDGALLWSLTLPLPFPVFMGLRFLEGAAHIAALSLLLGIAAGARGPEQRGRVMGLTGGGITLGVALGAPLGGLLGGEDPLVPLRAGAALVVVGAVVSLLFLEETGRREARPGWRAIASGVRAHKALVAPLAFSFADRFTVGFYTTTFSLYLTRIHDMTPSQIGALIAMFMLPFALFSYPFGRLAERRSRVALVCGGSVLYGVGTASLCFWPAELLPGLMLALGVASAVMFVPSLVLATDIAPAEVRTTALGAFNAAGSLGFILGPATGGLVSQLVADRTGDWATGYTAAFAVAGVSELLCVAVALPTLAALVRAGRTT